MELLCNMIEELELVGSEVDDRQVEDMCDVICSSKRVFAVGKGRSGLIARMFAMRLMHMGISAFVIDEVVTPSIQKNDCLLICSGSGETGSLKVIADKAKSIGASILLITANSESYLAEKADKKVVISGYPPKNEKNTHRSIQPMGSQFEQLQLLTLDAIVLKIKERLGVTEEEMMMRHANLE